MHRSFTLTFAYIHLFIGLWLLMEAISSEQSVMIWLISLATFAFAGWLLRFGDRFSNLKLQKQYKQIMIFVWIDLALLIALALTPPFANVSFIAMMLVFAFASEFGKKAATLSGLQYSIIVWIDLYSSAAIKSEVFEFHTLMMNAFVLFFAMMIGHRSDLHLQESYIDSLTRLPNAAHFSRLFTHAIMHDRELTERHAILLLDIKRFQQYNEDLGHGFGDQLLLAISQKLKNEQPHWVARYDGDRFLIWMKGHQTSEEVKQFSQNLIHLLEQPWRLFEYEIQLQVHGGFSLYPNQSQHTHALLEQAKMAVERAKQERKAVCQYAIETTSSYTERFVIEMGIRKGLERSEFVVFYQPKVNIYSGIVCGVEALVRWNHPELGLLQPNKFIAIAEETGLIVELGEWVLRTACKQQAQWMKMKKQNMRICVNVSLKQLAAPHFLDSVKDILEESGLSARHLELEITESLAIQNHHSIPTVLQDLAQLGIKLTIDDFGTGYASYQHLHQLSIHAIKIDKSFMRGILHNPDGEAIVASIIQLAKSLQLTVTAEGVETFEQLMFLKKHQCDEAQGFLFLQPEAADVFEPYLTRGFAHISKAFQ
jgi:diguanylate cyclase (GGDEF)-like protein